MRPFSITVDGHTFTDLDLTGQDLVDAELMGRGAGIVGWAAVDPWAGPLELVNLIGVVVSRLTGERYDAIVTRLASTPAVDITAMLTHRKA